MSTLSITFGDDASEAFADWVNDHQDWCVKITPEDGSEPFDALLQGSAVDVTDANGDGWYHAVRFKRYTTETETEDNEVEVVRVKDLYVY